MKKLTKAIAAIMLMTAVFCAACTKDPNNNNGNGNEETTIPVVETERVVLVTVTESTKTVVKGCIVSDGGSQIIECGVCWSTQLSPDINDSHVIADSIGEVFSCEILGLSPDSIYNVRAYAINSKGIGYGNELSFIPLGQGGGPHEEHEYVDLGLPSGTLWATCNIGANTPEDYGDYFAWGETETKDTYNWGTYQYCTVETNEYSYYYTMLTKYCNDASYGFNGFADDLTVLLPEDDAATANWGGDWRMPTREEWNELLENTTNTWTTQNEVYGRLFTASNGASLFLPAAGSRWNDELHYAGSLGYYWSSSLRTGNPYDAWYLIFDSGNYLVDYDGRCLGASVRPVCSTRQN